MMKFTSSKTILILIILLAAFLRFWQLDINPPGVHADEADTGYSAYSILKTGLDPHGDFNPLAFSDSNTGGTHPPVYTYLLIPLVKFLGLNIFVERLPSAVLGTLTVILIFFLARKLFSSAATVLLVSLLFAINPWAIHISRQGLLEAISLFFVLLGTTLFLYAKEKRYLLIFSALSFGLAVFSYDAPKILLPPFLAILAIYQKETLLKMKKYVFAFILIFLLFYLLMLKLTFWGGEIADYKRSSIFNADRIVLTVDRERYLTKAPLWISSVFHNKLTVGFKNFLTSYSTIFSVNWFFINGANDLQRSDGRHGQFYIYELPFFFIGIFVLFLKRKQRLALFILAWMLIGALPGGLTTGNYAYRSVHVLPAPIFFSSVGIIWFWDWLRKFPQIERLLVKTFFLIVCMAYTSSYLFTYFFDYPVYASEWWAKQQNDALKFAVSQGNIYERIFIDGGETWAITYAFYTKNDPLTYQNAFKNQTIFDEVRTINIDKFSFGMFSLIDVATPSAYFPKNSLIITNAVHFPNAPFLKAFNDPGGIRPIFKAFEVR